VIIEPCASIDLSALQHNLDVVLQLAPHSKIIAVIKADAYGHGLLPVAKALKLADMLAVARISEAKILRDAGITRPILVLEGFLSSDEIVAASELNLDLVVHQNRQIDLLEQTRNLPIKLGVWLKIDTGMHRLGIDVSSVDHSYQRLLALDILKDKPKLMTHFANADDIDHSLTSEQIKCFVEVAKPLDTQCSLANSAAIFAWPESHMDWVRPGIMLYGASPILGKTSDDHYLKPVMTLTSQLIAINHYKKGDCIGYGSTWCCPEDMPVGVVGIGYGDGYPRHAPSGTPVVVNEKSTQLIGRVSMDMLTIDLRNIEAIEGDEVTLWGKGLPAENVAKAAGTISYELFCGVTSRVMYRYINE